MANKSYEQYLFEQCLGLILSSERCRLCLLHNEKPYKGKHIKNLRLVCKLARTEVDKIVKDLVMDFHGSSDIDVLLATDWQLENISITLNSHSEPNNLKRKERKKKLGSAALLASHLDTWKHSLQRLALERNEDDMDGIVNELIKQDLPNLTRLYLISLPSAKTGELLAAASFLTNLRCLGLGKSNSDAAAVVAKCSNLTSLGLTCDYGRDTEQMTAAVAKAMHHLTHLKELNFATISMTKAAGFVLSKAPLTQLTYFCFSDHDPDTRVFEWEDGTAEALQQIVKNEHWQLKRLRSYFTPEGAATLANATWACQLTFLGFQCKESVYGDEEAALETLAAIVLETFEAFAKGYYKHLQELSLSGASIVTSLEVLVREQMSFPALKKLEFLLPDGELEDPLGVEKMRAVKDKWPGLELKLDGWMHEIDHYLKGAEGVAVKRVEAEV